MKKALSLVLVLVLVLTIVPALASNVVLNDNTVIAEGEVLFRFNGQMYVPIGTYMYDNTTADIPANIDSNVDTSGQITEQAYFWHARFYEETGIGKTKTWKNVVVHDDEYLVVGGTIVNGVDEGVYQGYGPGTYTIKVTDGLIAIVDDDWGSLEFNFRVNQAITYGWAHAHIDRGPIPE